MAPSGKEEPQAEMARMAHGDGASHRRGEAEPEGPVWPLSAVVSSLAPVKLELKGSQATGANTVERLNHRILEPAPFQLFPKHLCDKGLLAFPPLGPLARIALAAAQLEVARHDERCGGLPDARFPQERRPKVLLVAEADELHPEFGRLVVEPESAKSVQRDYLIRSEPVGGRGGDMGDSPRVAALGSRVVEGVAMLPKELPVRVFP
jgi:hypothetical protein